MRNRPTQKNLAPKPDAARAAVFIAFGLITTVGSIAAQPIWLAEATPGGPGATPGIVVNQGGTLLSSASESPATERINNSSTMSGATVIPGAITLSNNSTIDSGAGASVTAFADNSAQSSTETISTDKGNGILGTGNGTGRFYFRSDAAGLAPTQLSQIAVYSDSGTAFLGTAGYANDLNDEVVPLPEPTSWLAAALAFGALAFTQRRRMRKAISTS